MSDFSTDITIQVITTTHEKHAVFSISLSCAPQCFIYVFCLGLPITHKLQWNAHLFL